MHSGFYDMRPNSVTPTQQPPMHNPFSMVCVQLDRFARGVFLPASEPPLPAQRHEAPLTRLDVARVSAFRCEDMSDAWSETFGELHARA